MLMDRKFETLDLIYGDIGDFGPEERKAREEREKITRSLTVVPIGSCS